VSSLSKPQRRSLGTLIGGAAYGRAFRRIEPALDADAAKYLAAVEAADNQVLEDGVKRAVSAFVRACKADGNWDAIKASCILCGARTLAGALVPLKGAAPTNYNFVGLGTDYTRDGGLQGDGSTKYLNSNRNNNADPQDDRHLSVFVSSAESSGNAGVYTGVKLNVTGSNGFGRSSTVSNLFVRNVSANAVIISGKGAATGFMGTERNVPSGFNFRANGANTTHSQTSQLPLAANTYIFAANDLGGIAFPTNARLAFYSIGEAVDLATLDTAVSTLVSEIGAAV